MYFKRCARCGSEYQYTVSQCADCGGALEDAPIHPQIEAISLLDALQLVPLRSDHPWAVEELAVALQNAGIPSRIDTDPPGAAMSGPGERREGYAGFARPLAVYVRERDLEAARRVDQEVFESRTPDAAGLEAAHGDSHACPACGVALAENAAACGECGLEFPEA